MLKRDRIGRQRGSMKRRDFLGQLPVGTAALSVALNSPWMGRAGQGAGKTNEVMDFYPGARALAGPWRLRLDPENKANQQLWHKNEPSDRVARAVSVTVPSCWQEFLPDFQGGVAWYFKDFKISRDLRDQVLSLKFWAVDYFAQVWLNGTEVGSHEGGFTPFELDITDSAKIGGTNRLVVRVVDPPRPSTPHVLPRLVQAPLGLLRWEGTSDGVVEQFNFMEIPMASQYALWGLNFGGIWQPVELLSTDLLYVSDVFVEPKLAAGAIEAHLELTNKGQGTVEGKATVAIKPWRQAEKTVGHAEKTFRFSPGLNRVDVPVKIDDPHPWSVEDPYLYVAEVTVQESQRSRHSLTARFGLREFTIKKGYFHLNGKRIFLKGSDHQGCYPTTLAYPPNREFAYREIQIAKEAGFNFFRLLIKPAPLALLDAADELGFLLQEEPPLGAMRDSDQLLARGTREVTELLRRDRNRPSIVIWNMTNELSPATKVVGQLCRRARELDPTRLTTETAGGHSRYYLPYSKEGVSYLTEHGYPGAPIADEVYDYWNKRSGTGKLFFITEYGYGGMDDVEAMIESYRSQTTVETEDYRAYVRLKELRTKSLEESKILKQIFGDLQKLQQSSQEFQAEAVRFHTEALRANPAVGGYAFCQLFDSNALEIDGVVDFWRNKRKKAFDVMQELNKPLVLILRCSPMNARSGQDVDVKVTLVNEEQLDGQKKLTMRMKSPSGREVFSKEVTVEVRPWVSVVFQEKVRLSGPSGRYSVEATLWSGNRRLIQREDYFTMFHREDIRWPSRPFALFDVAGQLTDFLGIREARYFNLGNQISGPTVILVTRFSALWRQPTEFRKFLRLFGWVERGCTAVFLGVPEDGPGLTGAAIHRVLSLSPVAVGSIFPFRVSSQRHSLGWGVRVGPYSWGVTEPVAGIPVPHHAVYQGVPSGGFMGREFGNVAPVSSIETDVRTAEETGPAVQIYSHGKGRIILTSLELVPNLARDALAEKLFVNLLNYADRELPSDLETESPEFAKKLQFQERQYDDCLSKVLEGN